MARSLAGDHPIMDGTRPGRQVVHALRDRADLVIDTSVLTAADLKRLLTGCFAPRCGQTARFCHVLCNRHGIPRMPI